MANTMTTPGFSGWIQYAGPDSAAARKFYADVVGWNIADMPMQDGSSYPGIMVGDEPIGGFSPQPQDKGSWNIFITVEDVDAATERAKAASAKILVEPVDMPGVGRMATVEDPQGGCISLITYESMQK